MKKILMLLASKNFRDIEFIGPHAIFKQQGLEIDTTADQPESIGRFGYRVKHNQTLDTINPKDYDGLFIVGGLGILDYEDNHNIRQLVSHFAKEKVLGAICTAPHLIVTWQLTSGRKITAYDRDGSFTQLCKSYPEVKMEVAEDAISDQNLITGNGPEASELVANIFIKALESNQ